jgi:AcrR family transcriptional regulator
MRSTPGTRGTFTEEARRAQIVDCAVEAIAELGYGAASIRKIAERVGVAMSVVLYHFGNKDDLVAAIVDRAYRSMLASMVPAVEVETTATGKMHAYIRKYMAYMEADRALLLALAEIWPSYRSRDGLRLDELGLAPDVQDELAKVDLETILRTGRRGGGFGDVPVKSVAIALRGALDGSVAQIMRDSSFDAAAYGEHVAEMFDRVIGGKR